MIPYLYYLLYLRQLIPCVPLFNKITLLARNPPGLRNACWKDDHVTCPDYLAHAFGASKLELGLACAHGEHFMGSAVVVVIGIHSIDPGAAPVVRGEEFSDACA